MRNLLDNAWMFWGIAFVIIVAFNALIVAVLDRNTRPARSPHDNGRVGPPAVDSLPPAGGSGDPRTETTR